MAEYLLRNEKNNGNSVISGLHITEFQPSKKNGISIVWQFRYFIPPFRYFRLGKKSEKKFRKNTFVFAEFRSVVR
jgi:hypothetical protein